MLKALTFLAWVLVALPVHGQQVDFTLPDLKGVEHKLSDYRGKWAVVNYWATWCPPCLHEIPELVDYYESNQDSVIVLGVNFEDISLEQLQDFVAHMDISYPVLREQLGPKSALGMIPGLPTSFLIDPRGELAARKVGPLTGEIIDKFIDDYDTAVAKAQPGGGTAAAAGSR
jgi:thiol-disulfide isomerase/thioredoxin